MTDTSTLVWRKATASANGGECVEVAALPDGGTAVRDSKHPDVPPLMFTRAEMRAWVAGAKAGEFDDLT